MTGYRIVEEWMGEPVTTLADVWPERPRAMIVGLNPAPKSVEIGHYYQGASGQRQLGRLVEAGIFAKPDGSYFEQVALESGIGFTDIVKRPTTGESGVAKAEVAHGAPILAAKLEERRVSLVICVFRHPVTALLGSESPPGLAATRTSWGARLFRLPGPFEARAAADATMTALPPLLDI